MILPSSEINKAFVLGKEENIEVLFIIVKYEKKNSNFF